MIIDDLKNINFYSNFNSSIKLALRFIKDNANCFAKEGRYEINKNIYAVIETSIPKSLKQQKLEAHRKYIDVQYIVDGYDVIGYRSLLDCYQIYKDYDETKDIEFFNDKPDFNIVINEGHFSIFFPSDAHAPLCGEKPVKKCIVKIDVNTVLSK
ncbi:MAG: YhcH/YjgK/YiaL family protein [Endomicrobium sp.]|jgi:YhcH/YjgK/YiaL family protein|nr:YhcH/YjgK/YiaL family protein [Endomicrobium sp.]